MIINWMIIIQSYCNYFYAFLLQMHNYKQNLKLLNFCACYLQGFKSVNWLNVKLVQRMTLPLQRDNPKYSVSLRPRWITTALKTSWNFDFTWNSKETDRLILNLDKMQKISPDAFSFLIYCSHNILVDPFCGLQVYFTSVIIIINFQNNKTASWTVCEKKYCSKSKKRM